jgi:hypothetical protein
MKQNRNQGKNKPSEQENKKRKETTPKDGFRYDYDDSSDLK